MIEKTLMLFQSIWKMVVEQSKAKQLHGQMELNNPMPGRGPFPLWRQGPTDGMNEQMETDRFLKKTIKTQTLALFWLWNLVCFHLFLVFDSCTNIM
jgi:hypothetical protein